jgi:hypothetical protein
MRGMTGAPCQDTPAISLKPMNADRVVWIAEMHQPARFVVCCGKCSRNAETLTGCLGGVGERQLESVHVGAAEQTV